MSAPHPSPGPSLLEIALLFLRLGATSFGGPAAHIAIIRHECVVRRQWLDEREFLDLLGAVNLIPGPNSTEMAIHIGYRQAGWRGLLVAGMCFILPAMIIVGLLAWAYVEFHTLPPVAAVLYVVKPVMLAVVADALIRMAATAVHSVLLGVVAVLAAACVFLGAHELLVLVGAGLLVVAATGALPQKLPPASMLLLGAAPPIAGGAVASLGLWPLFLFFVKVGSVLFGSGYVLFAFLRADLVDRWGWLTETQLLDAIAVGQVTPGPVFTTATFIGYLLLGWVGALVATAGIFLPAFVFVAISGPLIPRIRKSPVARSFLDGLTVASLALMAVVLVQLGRSSLVDWPGWTLAAVSAILLIRFKVNSAWLLLISACLGLAAAWAGWL